ncbi:MAG: 1-acyl-sn-glycerol-3-phosphate acyltransferase [Acidobacteriota bacterium]|jgi:1-acyl-sn-glycerol-3-phosphate acyltransferase|nr:1-acyl-sn-glycerol-3-phosphate acyltransferase [Acidobacteriota bacterium]
MHFPEVGPRVARLNSPWLRRWGRRFLSRRGWTISGNLPDLSHMILLGAPHTSNWDLLYCLAFECALGFKANWVGKQSLFFWPLGPLMRRLGGVPVNRRFPRQMLRDTVAYFRERAHLILAIAPEGTRRKVEKWKHGFHRIARAADVPIVPICMNFGARTFTIGSPYIATENVESDIRTLKEFYAGAVGRRPENT